ncbi:hypothetical protein [Paenibacillus kobensis]|uniref:hypothetical protein n=1 Tax=Paenibacillus kobensis TaxID=59841 RepID=UPI000FDB0007|nr:hypothetical protein [Paenibacillus kobensis]
MKSLRSHTYRSSRPPLARIAAAVALAAVVSGCSISFGTDNEDRITGNDPLPSNNQTTKTSQGPGLDQGDPQDASWLVNNANAADTKEATNASNAASTKSKTQETKWDKTKPTLAGIALGEQKADVKKKSGAPLDSYDQEDEETALEIYEYDGYTVGFGPNAQGVLFIEIYDKKVNSGLSALHVGDKEDQAVKALGKPASQTPYLLSYETKNGLLKLDLDPDNHEIVTLKLFTQS